VESIIAWINQHRTIVSDSKNALERERTIARLRPTLDRIDRDLVTFACDAKVKREIEILLAQFKDEILADGFGLRTSQSRKPAELVPEHSQLPPPRPLSIGLPAHVVTPTPEIYGAWLKTAITYDNGKPLHIAANVEAVFATDPALQIFAWDEMRYGICMIKPLPGMRVTDQATLFRPRLVTDDDVSAVHRYVQRGYLPRASAGDVRECLRAAARKQSYHAIRSELEALEWDGTPRLASWLSTCLGVADSAYTRAVGRMFLISLVARIMKPGCQADYVLVIEGDEGILKSTACRILAGDPEYFSDSLPPIHSVKDAAPHLEGKWLIELPELAAITKGDVKIGKAFLTSLVDRYRPSYSRSEVARPRQSVFIGTTNETIYLTDPTGNRRYWPVRAETIDVERLRNDRDQLFAEAVAAWRSGENWWPDPQFEKQHIWPEQDRRYEADAWEKPILEWLEKADRATIVELIAEALSMDRGSVKRAHQNRAIAIMTRLGWKRAPKDSKGSRFWVRGPHAALKAPSPAQADAAE
jgi:hypothetical protein